MHKASTITSMQATKMRWVEIVFLLYTIHQI